MQDSNSEEKCHLHAYKERSDLKNFMGSIDSQGSVGSTSPQLPKAE
jgi:hypothetical protein